MSRFVYEIYMKPVRDLAPVRTGRFYVLGPAEFWTCPTTTFVVRLRRNCVLRFAPMCLRGFIYREVLRPLEQFLLVFACNFPRDDFS